MASSDCLFVRNLTKDTTREELTALFQSDYVIKHAIIIHERHGGPSKGFGFVTFALESDAKEAMERDNFSLKGNKLKLAFAANNKDSSSAAEAEAQTKADVTVVDWKTRKDERRKTPEMIELEKRTVVLFGVGTLTEAQLRKRLKKRAGGTVESISNFKEGDDASIKRVVYAHSDAVNGAVKEINGRTWGSSSEEGGGEENIVFARRLAQVALTPHQRSKSRLICRNLAFSVTKEEVEQEFRKFGPVEEIVVNAKGFGFVQFYCRTDAEKAVELVNGTTTLGPKKPNGKRGVVAVDFALTKDHYEKLKTLQEEPAVAEEEIEEEEPAAEEEKEAISSSSSSEGNSDDEEEESATEDDEEESASEQEEEEEAPPVQQTKAQVDKGVRDRRTLFVRNLLFETTEETLRERFKEFGPVRGVKLCRDATQRSRGMGFVEFWQPESCDKALSTGGALLLEGRELYCNLAVDKNQAEGLRAASAAGDVKEDKRHLHLVKASKVPANLVPASDIKKREFQDQETKTKLKNPLFFVSETRLSVKNLCRKPSETPDAKMLRSVFKACAIRGLKERLVIEPPPRTSVRVLKATVFQEEGKQELSTGFGFVEMSSHAHAMAALKVLNNSPEFAYLAAGGKQAMKLPEERRPRLIVSFAIENGAKVRAQKVRAQESSKPSTKKKPKEEKEEKEGEEKSSKKQKRKRDEPRVVKKVRPHLDGDGESREQEPQQQRAPKPKPLTNKAFERSSNAKRNTDELDQIMSKRSKMFDEPDAVAAATESKKKRWFEE